MKIGIKKQIAWMLAIALPAFSATAEPRIITYKAVAERELALHVFEPEGAAKNPRPCVLVIHSGGWTGGSPSKYYWTARTLRKMGFVSICMEYRLVDKKNLSKSTVFDAVSDAQDAMRFLRRNATELNIAPNRIAVCGGSAGGHLAAGLAEFNDYTDNKTSNISFRPDLLILLNSVIDTSKEGFGNRLIGSDWEQISPLHQVQSNMPPTLIFHGTADQTVPFKGAAAFHQSMLDHGNICEFHPFEGGDHGYYYKKPTFYETMQLIHDFCIQNQILPPLDLSHKTE